MLSIRTGFDDEAFVALLGQGVDRRHGFGFGHRFFDQHARARHQLADCQAGVTVIRRGLQSMHRGCLGASRVIRSHPRAQCQTIRDAEADAAHAVGNQVRVLAQTRLTVVSEFFDNGRSLGRTQPATAQESMHLVRAHVGLDRAHQHLAQRRLEAAHVIQVLGLLGDGLEGIGAGCLALQRLDDAPRQHLTNPGKALGSQVPHRALGRGRRQHEDLVEFKLGPVGLVHNPAAAHVHPQAHCGLVDLADRANEQRLVQSGAGCVAVTLFRMDP